jgi:hypothetical protein
MKTRNVIPTSSFDPQNAKQISKNIDLAGRFLRAMIDNPAHMDEIPDHASVIGMPEDDLELAQQNRALAFQLAD